MKKNKFPQSSPRIFIQFSRQVKVIFLMASLLILSAGCAFQELEEELQEYDKSYGIVGQVKNVPKEHSSIVVILYQNKDMETVVSQYLLTDSTNYYSFIVSEGTYQVVAFEDANNNLTYDEGELYGSPDDFKHITMNAEELLAKEEKSKKGLNFTLNLRMNYPDSLPVSVPSRLVAGKISKHLGIVTTLDNELFTLGNGSLGFWKPLSFLKEIGIGIFFTEPYDPAKIPLLIVHGALGTPLGWEAIVEKLDPDQYQPWYFYYPSGFRLDAISDTLNAYVKELHDEYHFERMYVMAHSMGGLVSRSFIMKNMVAGNHSYIKKFISISTPWGGVSTASLGLKHAPTAIPSWHDVSPDSAFLNALYKEQLPEELEFYLLFGVQGKCSMMMENNDGTVEISSEIDYRAQSDADGFYGFDEDHMSILESERVVEQIVALITN